MDYVQTDVNRELMLDGNSAAGLLYEIFSAEMTAAPAECATCGNVSAMATLLVFGQAMGTIMRCPACGNIMVRMARTPTAVYVDARGTALFHFTHAAGDVMG